MIPNKSRGSKLNVMAAVALGLMAILAANRDGSTQQTPTLGAVQPSRITIPQVLDLRQAIDIALRTHPGLASAEAKTLAAKTGIAVAGASYWPTVTGAGTITKTLAGNSVVTTVEGAVAQALTTEPIYTPSVTLSVPLFREGRLTYFMTLPSENVAKAGYDAVFSQQQVSRNDVIRSVAEAFYTVLSTREEIKVNEQLVKLNQLLLEDARRKFEQQLIPQAEVLTAEVALVTAEANLAVSRTTLVRTLSDFGAVIGVDPSAEELQQLELVDGGADIPTLEVLTDLVSRAVNLHPSIQAQDAVVKKALASLELLESERYPNITTSTSVLYQDNFSLPLDLWSVRSFFQLSWKAYDFGTLNLKLQQQRETIQAEKRALDQIKNQVIQSVIGAYQTFISTRAGLESARKGLLLQQELTRAARERFQQNLVPLSFLVQAEANLAVSQKTLNQTQLSLRSDFAKLQAAVGAQ